MAAFAALREDLLMQVRELAAKRTIRLSINRKYRNIRTSSVAATFDFRDEDGNGLSDVSQLDTMVTVI